ncbi:MAG: dipeptidase [Agriterribacter sp.]
MKKRFVIDAHLDLAMNGIEWNRDIRLPVKDIRAIEQGMQDTLDRGRNTVSLPALREGNIGLVVATQLARFQRDGHPEPGNPYYHSPEICWGITQAQIAYYKVMEELGEMIQITDKVSLHNHLDLWLNPLYNNTISKKTVGYILSLEGADSFVTIDYLYKAYGYGLRALGVSHYGQGRYAGGTSTETGFSQKGRELLKEMEKLNIILDITHLTDQGFKEALDLYKGPIWASHHNCRSLVKGQRQLTDNQLKILIERRSVIGGALDTWMLTNDWVRGVDDPRQKNIGLEKIVDHYDHICQLAGNSLHCAIGSDLDGMFGTEQSPYDIDTIADVQNLEGFLVKRGYGAEDIDNIFYKNWMRFLLRNWI